jgi:hypothetical protein
VGFRPEHKEDDSRHPGVGAASPRLPSSSGRAGPPGLHGARFARDVTMAGVSLIFAVLFICYSRNTGQDSCYQVWGPFLMAGLAMLVGIPVYRHMRTRMTEPPPVPEYH